MIDHTKEKFWTYHRPPWRGTSTVAICPGVLDLRTLEELGTHSTYIYPQGAYYGHE